MNLGDQHEIEGVLYQVTSFGHFDDDQLVIDGGTEPEPGDDVLVVRPDEADEDEPERVWVLETVESVVRRIRRDRLNLEMDMLMPEVREKLLPFGETKMVPLEVCESLMRVACGAGYEYAAAEEPLGAFRDRILAGDPDPHFDDPDPS